MKNSLWFVASVALFLASCSTGNKMQSSATTDDLYVAKTESYVAPATDQVNSNDEYQSNSSTESDETTSEKYSDESGNTYITNNYYDNNSYTSQLNRWYNPGLGFGYFSPFYTGYSSYDPFHYSPGFSISIGFNQGWGNSWYNPYYYPMYSYNPWNPYYNPWYSSGFGYNPYGNGFGYNPYGYGNSNGYYDSYGSGYSSGNSYSGPRGSVSSNTSGTGDGRQYKSTNGTQELNGEPVSTPAVESNVKEQEVKTLPSTVKSPSSSPVTTPVKSGGLNPSNTEQIKRGEKQVTNPGLQEPSKQLPQRTTPKLNLQQSNGGKISNESLFEKTAMDLDSKNSTQVNDKSDSNHRMVLDQGDDRPSLNSSSKTYTPDNKSRSNSDNRNSPSRPRRK